MKVVSKELKDLIFKMLQPERTRIQIDDIYKHPWLSAQLNKGGLRLNFGKMQSFSKFSKVIVYLVS